MGPIKLMKKLLGMVWRGADNSTFQQRAIKQAEKIADGKKIIAPKHPTDERVFKEAQRNKEIREELDTKHEKLVDQVNRINISASPPSPTQPPPDKESLRTHASAVDSSPFEYGVYELPVDKLTKNHLSLREALEVMRARIQIDPDSELKIDDGTASSSVEFLKNHPATKRVDAEKLGNMYRYFRPFIHHQKQRVVPNMYLKGVRDVASGKPDLLDIAGNPMQVIKELVASKKIGQQTIEGESAQCLEDEKQLKLAEEIRARRQEEYERFEQRIRELYEADEEMKKLDHREREKSEKDENTDENKAQKQNRSS